MDQLELEKVFSLAIQREIKAHEFYKEVAGRVTDETAQATFMELANEEMVHMETIEKIKMDPTTKMKFVAPAINYKIAEKEESPEPTIDMKPVDAIALAMKKEQEAVEFYQELADEATDEGIKEIFTNLCNMELNHKHRLETVFNEISYPEVF